MDTKIFEELGLTNVEIKVYLALLKLGTSTAGPILEKTELQNSTVHLTLHKLTKKGYVKFIKKGRIKYYSAINPENILKIIENKKKEFKNILPELLSLQTSTDKQEAEIYEGYNGFQAMLYDLIKGGKKGDEFLFFSFDSKNKKAYEKVYAFYEEFDKEILKSGVKSFGIAPVKLKKELAGRKNIKFVNFPTPTNISIFNDQVIFTPWGDKVISFLIRSKELAESLRVYFYSIYKK